MSLNSRIRRAVFPSTFAAWFNLTMSKIATLPCSTVGGPTSVCTWHKTAGEITLQQMLHEWSLHDLGHIRQVAELVRARKHWEQAGPLGSFYKLLP